MKQSGSTPGGKSGLWAKSATVNVAQRLECVALASPWADRLAMKHSCPNAVLDIASTAAAASATDAKNRLDILTPPYVRPSGAPHGLPVVHVPSSLVVRGVTTSGQAEAVTA